MKRSRQVPAPLQPPGVPAILFSLGDFVLAIAASAVAEIQVTQGMQPVAKGNRGNVCNTLFRDGRHFWVVDTNLHFNLLPTRSKRILLLADLPVALKVDSILRMTELKQFLPLPLAFRGEERQWYLGLAVVDQQVIPVVNPASVLSQEVLHELTAGLPSMKLQTAGAIA